MRVLFLDLDTLLPDHLGCYGYHRNTSPNIDSIAAQGVRFNNYYCSDAPCLPSRAALMTGQLGIHSGVVGHGGTAADLRLDGPTRTFHSRMDAQCLPRILRRAGMHTASISPFGERHSAFWFYAGFNEIHNTGKYGGESAEEITPTVLKWIESNASRDNWFLHVNYWDPHTSYRAPAEFGNPFAGDPLPAWITPEVLQQHQKKVGPHSARELNMFNNQTNPHHPRYPGEILNMDHLRQMIDGYDCGIRYMDDHIGRLFDALRAQGVMDDLMVIISSDHGENQGELGIYGEHGTADNITCRIPMIIRHPRARKGHVDNELHYNCDLSPTLADLFQQKIDPRWDGRSYAPTLLQGTECGREYLVISQCAHVCQRSVRFGPWLYMRTYHDGYHLFADEMLFHIEQDPHEQKNIAGSRPDICREGAWHLLNWHGEMMQTSTSDVDPLWTVMREGGPEHARGKLKGYCERLQATGRGDAIPELARRHPSEGVIVA